MKLFLQIIFAILVMSISRGSPLFAGEAPAAKAPVVLGIFDRQKKVDCESKVMPVLQSEFQGCGECVLKNFSPYDVQGNFITDANLAHQLELLSQEANIIFVNYNERVTASNKAVVEALKAAQASGHLVVFAAGQPSGAESSAPLSQTLAGQVPNALIIGELGERDRLLGTSYFGPEMLTAIRPPKDQLGQGLAPAIFAGRLAKVYHKRNDWVKYLGEKKLANRKIWLELNDCFRF